jgi:hypothetical protein
LNENEPIPSWFGGKNERYKVSNLDTQLGGFDELGTVDKALNHRANACFLQAVSCY